ncbi:hypothetical protein TSUD_349090 [Trifolium subterraneum]|uniref:phospholipase D n=1 Tax=Trifolium subterraneum TaxID=3900 RepID=A0A2Z6NWQ3_TRISU|nr:hypothetical protein TSUD_349090 [Trifolium subterraneum]
MDNHGSSPPPYGYPNPYGYPPYPYPPPPQHQSQGPSDQYPYPYPPATTSPYSYESSYPPNSSHSTNYSYSYPPPPPPPNPLEYQTHQPSNAYPYPYPYPQPQPHHYQYPPISDESNPPHSSAYPPLNDLMSNVQISDNTPNAPLARAPPVRVMALSPVITHSYSALNEEKKEEFYGHASHNSFSGFEHSYSGLGDSPSFSDYSGGSFDDSVHNQSLQIVPVQGKGSLKVLLLHGNLDIWVHGANNLPNMDMFHKTLGDVFGGKGSMSRKITSDPYVSISLSNAVVGRTFVISNSENPVWEQHFHVPVAHHAAEVHFVVKDSDVVGSQLIGVVTIPVEQLYLGERVQGTYPILNSNGKPCKQGAVLSVSIQFIPIENLSMYHQGVGAGPEYIGVPGTYFPLRRGGIVTLYQDAHVPDGSLPNVMLDHGMHYAHGQCWRDIFEAIRQARRLVYITGWAVWHKVTLIRDPASRSHASEYSLGDLLRSKSQEGVRVLLLVWDDPTSRNILGYKTDGVMATHDEETRRFFKHSSVQVLLCPRMAGKRHSWAKQQEVGTIYTHHQKTVIVDADAGNNRRKIVAFVGGLDLCDGRYDTPQHPLFRTLKTLHKDDYHNPTFTGNTGGCPREPWHDLHSKIDGAAAYDVLTNFEERWLRAAKPKGIKKLKSSYDDALLKIERISDILRVSDIPSGDDNPASWHAQIFRSIDSNSVKGFPKEPKDASQKNLVCGKNVLIDMSIHTAYVIGLQLTPVIKAPRFEALISCANNLIPMEIALKIAEKIKANERFAVYIVIPMWPEGVPTGAATQRILFWQNKTMQMMYETIYNALVEVGLEAAFSPQDYLNFFCLGNRESMDINDNISVSGTPPPPNTPQV